MIDPAAPATTMPGGGQTIALSLISHTNAGKTTLARTLLRADIGEVRDAPHVTEFADAHELISGPEGDRLMLWDTPGFGDSARLAKRLRESRNPLGWLLSEVWDRWRDRPFWASQQAMRHVQEHSDVVLYLVNAAESPSTAAYVAAEMELLAWLDKPVLVLLNQLGEPREAAAEAAEAQSWQQHLSRWPLVRQVLPMDAFARCWVHERTLMQAVQTTLQGPKSEAMSRLAAAWQAQRQATFDAAVQELAGSVARMALMRQSLGSGGAAAAAGRVASGTWRQMRQLGRQLGGQIGKGTGGQEVRPGATAASGTQAGAAPDDATGGAGTFGTSQAATPAEQALLRALQTEAAASTTRLIRLHGLAGEGGQTAHTQAQIMERVAGQFALQERLPEGKAALWGGAVTGAMAGLKADIATGGLSLGGGMLAGALIGALGGAGLARGINVVRGADQDWLRVNDAAMSLLLQAALLRYLAVAHFGRGRGDWVAGEAPAHWPPTVARALKQEEDTLSALWRGRSHRKVEAVVAADPVADPAVGPDPTPATAFQPAGNPARGPQKDAETLSLTQALQGPIKRSLQNSFARLYPDSDNHAT